ncbi:MAG: carbohydrate ABC transporter permease, partial [Acidobacteria bacterium]
MPLLPPRWRLVLLGVAALSLPVIAGIVWLILTGSFGEVRGLVPAGPL